MPILCDTFRLAPYTERLPKPPSKSTSGPRSPPLKQKVLFSLFVIIDFAPDSDAKPEPPRREISPIVDVSETSYGADIAPPPEIAADSGGCSSEGCTEVTIEVTPTEGSKTTSSGSCSTRGFEASIGVKKTSDDGSTSVEVTGTFKHTEDGNGNEETKGGLKLKVKWR